MNTKMNTDGLVIAKWWEKTDSNKLLCTLCPRYCKIGEGQPGFCYIRQNHGGKLYTIGYGRPTGFAIDPIEKKPLNHFYPGSTVLSFGTAGCNLGCKFCQNWSISKAKLDDENSFTASPEEVIRLSKNISPLQSLLLIMIRQFLANML
jgi:pyruvate formate lyase activating enzyme